MLRGGGREKLMRKVLLVALFGLIFLAGLSVLLYPVISDSLSSRKHTQTIQQYLQAVESMSQQDFTDLFEAAHEYNKRLLSKPNRYEMTEEDMAEYRGLLDLAGLGVIGMLEIEEININLPIYHGTDEGVLQIGLGHLEGSSLPVGGPGTHAVITGHRGLPSSTLLTNIDRLIIGDMFKIHVLNETLIYRVDQLIIVEPHETASLAITPGADHCTLVTCTPYGINTHRLLVRGYRISIDEAESHLRPSRIPQDARVLTDVRAALLLIVPAFIVVLVVLFIRLRRVYGRGKKR